MTNEKIKEIENDRAEETEAALTVEVPTEIRAGIISVPAARSCSPYSSCYSNRVLVATAG